MWFRYPCHDEPVIVRQVIRVDQMKAAPGINGTVQITPLFPVLRGYHFQAIDAVAEQDFTSVQFQRIIWRRITPVRYGGLLRYGEQHALDFRTPYAVAPVLVGPVPARAEFEHVYRGFERHGCEHPHPFQKPD